MNEDPYRHPGGRTCAGAMLLLALLITSGTGLAVGFVWALTHVAM